MALPEVENEPNSFSGASLTDFTPMTAESCLEISLDLRSEADRLTIFLGSTEASGSGRSGLEREHDLRTDEDISRSRALRQLYHCRRAAGPDPIGGQRIRQE